MAIRNFDWDDRIVEKIIRKHGVTPEEVEEVFASRPYLLKKTMADRYLVYGRTEEGRYLLAVYVRRTSGKICVISARDMDDAERKYFKKWRG